MTLTAPQYTILFYLHVDSEYCMNYKHLKEETNFYMDVVKKTVQELKKLGLVEYHRGLLTEDGIAAGSGFCRNYSRREEIDLLMEEFERIMRKP